MTRSVFRRLSLILVVFCLGCTGHDPEAKAGLVFVHDGHTYEIVKTKKTWDQASTAAAGQQKYGVAGYLVRINSAEENQAIFDQLIANIPSSEFANTAAPDGGGGSYAWIGATDAGTEGEWIWSKGGDQFWSGGKDGSPVGSLYSNWGTVNGIQNEPDNYNNYQNVAAISLNGWPKSDQHLGSASQWNDINADNQLYYVIEYDAVPEPSSAALFGVLFLMIAPVFLGKKKGTC